MQTDDTIVAIATPPGQGALGIIRLSGSNAITITDVLFKGTNLESAKGYTIHYGSILDAKGQVVDEVLVSLFKNPKSFTGEDIVEISCHGSSYILKEVLQLCIELGARLAQPGEFTKRAFLNGKMDLTEAEGVADLIASESAAEHKMAMQQMRGGFSAEIKKLKDQLIHFASLIELELDFGEEDVEFADREKLESLVNQVQQYISKLLTSFKLGNAIKNGITTVIAGRPNAGKSTLLNALLNEERAIVSDIAGTTRDTIEEQLNINGVRFRLVDTAGLREANDTIEKIGVERTIAEIGKSTVLLYVYDITELPANKVLEEIEKSQISDVQSQNLIIVANKMDLYPNYSAQELEGYSVVNMSAVNKMNVEELKRQLYTLAVTENLNDDVVVSNTRHFEALTKTNDSLLAVLDGLEKGITQDFLAMDIRNALHALGEITGEITTDDLLGNIFSKFCIGK